MTRAQMNWKIVRSIIPIIGLWIIAGYLVTRRISRNDSLMGNLGPVIFFGFIIFFASFELLEWISSEICQTTGN